MTYNDEPTKGKGGAKHTSRPPQSVGDPPDHSFFFVLSCRLFWNSNGPATLPQTQALAFFISPPGLTLAPLQFSPTLTPTPTSGQQKWLTRPSRLPDKTQHAAKGNGGAKKRKENKRASQ